MKYINLILILLLIPICSAYQQSHLEFELDESWSVLNQRTAAQTFEKNGMYLEVYDLKDDSFNAEEFALGRDGIVVSELTYGAVTEWIIEIEDTIYILSVIEDKGETYSVNLVAPKAELVAAQTEMRELYGTFEIKPDQKFVEAAWEEELEYPEELSLSQKIKVPWLDIIFWLIVLFIVFLIFRKRIFKKKHSEHKKKKKHTKK